MPIILLLWCCSVLLGFSRDGRVDLLAGNYWFKYQGGNSFRPITVGMIGGRIRAGKFKPGKYPQIVIAPGDGSGPLLPNRPGEGHSSRS